MEWLNEHWLESIGALASLIAILQAARKWGRRVIQWLKAKWKTWSGKGQQRRIIKVPATRITPKPGLIWKPQVADYSTTSKEIPLNGLLFQRLRFDLVMSNDNFCVDVSFPEVRPCDGGGQAVFPGPFKGPGKNRLTGQGLLSTSSSHEKEQVHRASDRLDAQAA